MTQKEVKEEIILLLGNKCSNPYNLKECSIKLFKCAYNTTNMFMIDHINNNGNYERMSFNHGINAPNIYCYKHILEEIKKGSKEYQLLCFICNKHKNKLYINNWCKKNNKPFLELQKLRQKENKYLFEKFRDV